MPPLSDSPSILVHFDCLCTRNTTNATTWSKSVSHTPSFRMSALRSSPFVRPTDPFFTLTYFFVRYPPSPCTKTLHSPRPGQIICEMLPLLMMRHRRISRTKWKDCVSSTGKHWIEQVCVYPYLAHDPTQY